MCYTVLKPKKSLSSANKTCSWQKKTSKHQFWGRVLERCSKSPSYGRVRSSKDSKEYYSFVQLDKSYVCGKGWSKRKLERVVDWAGAISPRPGAVGHTSSDAICPPECAHHPYEHHISLAPHSVAVSLCLRLQTLQPVSLTGAVLCVSMKWFFQK